MAAEPKRSSTPVEESVLNTTAFSIDSLQIGDSTRSLLSPLYDKNEKHKNNQSDRSKLISEHDSSTNSSEKSRSDGYSSDFEGSDNTTVKKVDGKEVSSSESSRSSSSSFSSSSTTLKSNHKHIKNDVDSSEIDTKQEPLSPWEKWLLTKVVEDKKRIKANLKSKQIQKQTSQEEIARKMEKEKQAVVNRKEWLRLKRNEENIKNELARRLEQEKVQKELEKQERIQAKAKESFEEWFQQKEHERIEQMKSRKMSKKVEKENELQRKQQSEEAYKLWLENAKYHQRTKNNHFGYLGGKVTGYYDWTCYPMPSYNNPSPWVSPKVHTQYQSKIKLQNPSPPLLFKQLEEREKKAKQTRQNNAKAQSRNTVC